MREKIQLLSLGAAATFVTYLVSGYLNNYVLAKEFSEHKIEVVQILIELKKDVEYIKERVNELR